MGEIITVIMLWEAGKAAAALAFFLLGFFFEVWILPVVILGGLVGGLLLYSYRMREGQEARFSGLRLTQR